ncbi:hypothetical protein [Hymenobacter rubidus]|uniref:hypothetical protein n=1 Tax=Hymenobacter rubidus TaxID=1441626 RepID=UPI00191EFCE5|nr:hypothetical protein [Hymenobacter rubidus]
MPAPKPEDLRNLAQAPDDNLGGIEALWYTRAADLLNFPATGELVIAQNLVLAPGACWYQLVSVRESVRYKQAPKDLGRHGNSYAQTLTGTLARHTAALAAGLEALEGQELVALYRDHNGEVQLVGTPEQPLSWKDAYDAGLVSGTRNNYDWTLSGETPRRARPYLGTWEVSGLGLESGLVLGTAGGNIDIRDRRGNLLATVDAGRTVVLRSGFRVAFTIV